MSNQNIIDIFERIAKLKEKKASITKDARERRILLIKSRQFRKAIDTIRKQRKKIVDGKSTMKLPGIGTGMANRIDEIIHTGTLRELDEYLGKDDLTKAQAMEDLSRVPGISSQMSLKLFDQGVQCLDDLRKRASELDLPQHIRVGLKHLSDLEKRIPFVEVRAISDQVSKILKKRLGQHIRLECCGSHRRRSTTSGDVDILMTWPTDKKFPKGIDAGNILGAAIDALVEEELIVDHLTRSGKKKYMGICRLDRDHPARHIDIRWIEPESWASAMLYFTGSGEFNQRMRADAKKKGYLLSEFGLYSVAEDGTRTIIPCKTERDIFKQLDWKWLEPCDRK